MPSRSCQPPLDVSFLCSYSFLLRRESIPAVVPWRKFPGPVLAGSGSCPACRLWFPLLISFWLFFRRALCSRNIQNIPCPICFQNASKESSGGKCQAQPCNPYCLTVLPESAPLGTLVLSDEVPSLCLSWKRLGCQKCGYKCEPHFGEVNTIWSSASTIRTAACGRVPYATYRAVQSPNQ